MRIVAVIAITALITLVTAFDYEASDLLFADELTPADRAVDDASEADAVPSQLSLDLVGNFAAPVDVIERPGDSRVFVVELMGTVSATDGTTSSTILDVSAQTLIEGERGLLGAAFHPTEELLYIHHSNLDGDSVIVEYQVDPLTSAADPASARQVLTVKQPYANHNGGEVTFGPDGYLYLGFGDGGSAGDPVRSALDLNSRLGKILRIDPQASDGAAFTIPSDNPFVTTEGADPTIWSYGLRNPWKFSFDDVTGGLWIADVGQNQWEEINFAAPADGVDAGRGLSFGWSAYEGDARFNTDQASGGHTGPFATYERTEGLCSISGGAVYRGEMMPQLDGWYLFGDYCTGQIFGFDTQLDVSDVELIELAQVDALVAIAAGPDGELYAASVAGPVFKLG